MPNDQPLIDGGDVTLRGTITVLMTTEAEYDDPVEPVEPVTVTMEMYGDINALCGFVTAKTACCARRPVKALSPALALLCA
jgi:hypothetical protein